MAESKYRCQIFWSVEEICLFLKVRAGILARIKLKVYHCGDAIDFTRIFCVMNTNFGGKIARVTACNRVNLNHSVYGFSCLRRWFSHWYGIRVCVCLDNWNIDRWVCRWVCFWHLILLSLGMLLVLCLNWPAVLRTFRSWWLTTNSWWILTKLNSSLLLLTITMNALNICLFF